MMVWWLSIDPSVYVNCVFMEFHLENRNNEIHQFVRCQLKDKMYLFLPSDCTICVRRSCRLPRGLMSPSGGGWVVPAVPRPTWAVWSWHSAFCPVSGCAAQSGTPGQGTPPCRWSCLSGGWSGHWLSSLKPQAKIHDCLTKINYNIISYFCNPFFLFIQFIKLALEEDIL